MWPKNCPRLIWGKGLSKLTSSKVCLILQGDSGGPVTYKHGDQHVLAGVIDFAGGDKDIGEQVCSNFTLSASVAFLRTTWIDTILNGATVCKHGVEADDWF